MKRIVIIAATAALSSTLLAEEAQEAQFDTTLAAGATLTKGNSESSQFNTTLVTEGEREDLGSVRAGAELNYGESEVDDENETNTDNFKLYGNAKKNLSARSFYYLDGSYFYDNVAEVDYRITIGPGLGYYTIKEKHQKLLFEAGPSYIWEEVAGDSDHYAALRLAERYDHKLSDTSKLWQSLEVLPQVDDFGRYLANFELGVEAKLNETLNLRVVLQDKYNSEPGDGNDENDITLIAGISMKL